MLATEDKEMQETSVLEELFREWAEEALKPKLTAQYTQAFEEGVQQGIAQGIERGMQVQQRDAILYVLSVRFKLSEPQARSVWQQLIVINDLIQLKEIFVHAVNDFSLADFQANLNQMAVI